jgi:hypothetical protein
MKKDLEKIHQAVSIGYLEGGRKGDMRRVKGD